MANAYTASTDLNSLPAYYHKVFLERLNPGPIMMDYATKKPYALHSGTTIYFPRMTNSSTTPSAYKGAQGTIVSTEKVQDAQVSAVVETYRNAKALWDVTELTAINGTVVETVREQADQAKNIIDKRIIQEGYGCSATPTGAGFSMFFYNTVGNADLGISTSAGFKYADETEYAIKAETLRAAAAKMRARNVRPFDDGHYALVCHSDSAYKLQADTEWQNAYIYTDAENVRKGVAGRYAGVKVVIDNNISTSANGSVGAVLYYSLLLGQGALGVSELDGGINTYSKKSGPTDTFNPVNEFISVGWKIHFVPKRLNVSCGLVLVTADA